MTQDEVDLIYNCLHKSYEYRDGEFYKKSTGRILKGTLQLRNPPCYIIRVSINKKRSKSIRLARAVFIYFNKRKPGILSFRDENPMNYKIENLYEVPGYMLKNYGKVNKHGFKGVEKSGNLFWGRITINGKRIRTQGFSTPEEAHAAYLKAKEEYREANT